MTSLGIAADHLLLVDRRVLLEVPEYNLGLDLNGDQDTDDLVMSVHDLRTGRTFDTGLSSFIYDEGVLALEGDVLVLAVSEFAQQADLDGDGDRQDFILHAVRLR